MPLRNHIPASSIAEVVMAIAVIASCISVSALVFSRTIRVTTDFESVRMQTEIQSELWKRMQLNQDPADIEGITLTIEEDPESDSLNRIRYNGNQERELWKQHWLKHE